MPFPFHDFSPKEKLPFPEDDEGAVKTRDALMHMTREYDEGRGRLSPEVHMQRWEEAYRAFDPRELRHDEKPDPSWLVWMEEVFGDYYREGRLILAIHPYFRRWAFFERQGIRDDTAHEQWRCVYIVGMGEGSGPGYLAPDLDVPDKRFEALRGYEHFGGMGEYRPPCKKDAEVLKAVDLREHTKRSITRLIVKARNAERAYWKSWWREYEYDLELYNYWRINTAANEGKKMYSLPSLPDKYENQEKYAVTKKAGYRVAMRKRSDASQEEIERAYNELRERQRRAEAARAKVRA